MNESPKNIEQERVLTPEQEQLVSQATKIILNHTDSSPDKHEIIISKEEKVIVMQALPFMTPDVRELIYFKYPEFAMRTLAEVAPKKAEQARNEGNIPLAEAYDLLSEKACFKSEIVFNKNAWKAIEDAW